MLFRSQFQKWVASVVKEIRMNGKYELEKELKKTIEENKNIESIVFQFYISKIRTVIEYIGEKHTLIKDLDKMKEDYCEDNYINLIRIRYDQFENIYSILWENLSNYIKKPL